MEYVVIKDSPVVPAGTDDTDWFDVLEYPDIFKKYPFLLDEALAAQNKLKVKCKNAEQ